MSASIVGLDYEDPRLAPFEAFQQFKLTQRESFWKVARSGRRGRTIAAGGWQSIPRLDMPGAMSFGDSGGGVNFPKIKAFTRRSVRACWPRKTSWK